MLICKVCFRETMTGEVLKLLWTAGHSLNVCLREFSWCLFLGIIRVIRSWEILWERILASSFPYGMTLVTSIIVSASLFTCKIGMNSTFQAYLTDVCGNEIKQWMSLWCFLFIYHFMVVLFQTCYTHLNFIVITAVATEWFNSMTLLLCFLTF